MTHQSDFTDFYSKGMQSFTDRLTESTLERMRTTAVGGASVALGVILLLLQTDLDSNALVVALYASIFAIPAWVVAWQYVEAYMFYGRPSYAHFNSRKGSLVAVVFAASGMLLLFTSIVSLIWHMSSFAAVAFLCVSILAAAVVSKHSHAVRVFSDSTEHGAGA